MAGKIKTDVEAEDRKWELEIEDSDVKNPRATLKDGEMAGRLRRGFSLTEGPRSVDAMARAACFSQRQFYRLMVQVLGETPGTHQRRLRLDRGAWLLLTSRATVLDVALETGFENHETFYAGVPDAICRYANSLSQESRKNTAAINTRWIINRINAATERRGYSYA